MLVKPQNRATSEPFWVKLNYEKFKPAPHSEPAQSADQNVPGVQSALCVAQEMGARLGHRALLLGSLPKKRENQQNGVKSAIVTANRRVQKLTGPPTCGTLSQAVLRSALTQKPDLTAPKGPRARVYFFAARPA